MSAPTTDAALPGRIVCLTEETTETLYLLGEEDRIVGISGFTVRPPRARERPGWEAVPAVATGELHELKSALILQPGPAALTDGVAELHRIIRRWAEG